MYSFLHKLIRWLKHCVTVLLMFLLFVFTLLTAGGYQTYQRALQERPIAEVIQEIRQQTSYTALSQIPQIYQNAVLAVEDPRFYQHKGIDLLAITEAFIRDLKAGELVAGGSTVTQQLCKNQFFTQKKRFTRKIAEVFMVRKLESICSKDDILELYINSIYYGSGYYNLAAAAAGYFGKLPAELNDWECTLLAGLPNAPSAYAPTKNPELALQRQRQVLDAMIKHRYMTQQQANEIAAQCPKDFL